MCTRSITRLARPSHALGTAFGDALDIGLCFVAFHLVLGLYLSYQASWNLAAVVLLDHVFEVGVLLNTPWTAYLSAACRLHLCTQHNRQRRVVHPTPYLMLHLMGSSPCCSIRSIFCSLGECQTAQDCSHWLNLLVTAPCTGNVCAAPSWLLTH